MKKKLIVFLSLICLCLCLAGCSQNKHDIVEIYNRSDYVFDNIKINAIDGYFYNNHEKLRIDDNTIAITIYFTKTQEDDEWK